jgi:hypothetical protein
VVRRRGPCLHDREFEVLHVPSVLSTDRYEES